MEPQSKISKVVHEGELFKTVRRTLQKLYNLKLLIIEKPWSSWGGDTSGGWCETKPLVALKGKLTLSSKITKLYSIFYFDVFCILFHLLTLYDVEYVEKIELFFGNFRCKKRRIEQEAAARSPALALVVKLVDGYLPMRISSRRNSTISPPLPRICLWHVWYPFLWHMSWCVGILLSFGSIRFYPIFISSLCNDWNFIFLSLSLVYYW